MADPEILNRNVSRSGIAGIQGRSRAGHQGNACSVLEAAGQVFSRAGFDPEERFKLPTS